jgi:hypothetical protein
VFASPKLPASSQPVSQHSDHATVHHLREGGETP